MTWDGLVVVAVCALLAALGVVIVAAGVAHHETGTAILGGLCFGTGVGFGVMVVLDA